MSHFFTVVLVPKDTQDIEAKIEELMAPYDENLKVDEYDTGCWCVNSKAQMAGVKAAEARWSMESIRKAFWNEVSNELSLMGITSGDSNFWEEQDKVAAKLNWSERTKGYFNYQEQTTKQHPMYNKPEPDCEDCQGTGFHKTTYSPASKWDWYVIGGRWDGAIQNNPRSSDNGFNFGDQHHQLQYNTIPVSDYLKICREDKGQYPFSIVLPAGQWCEKGKMGWFGITADEKSDWKETADKLLEKHQDCIAVGVDCHI